MAGSKEPKVSDEEKAAAKAAEAERQAIEAEDARQEKLTAQREKNKGRGGFSAFLKVGRGIEDEIGDLL